MWFLLAPFSSSLAKEGVNFVRFLNIFIPITFILALGVCSIRKKALFPIFIALYLVNFIIFLDAYFIHAPKKTGAWQYGYKQMVDIITPIQKYYQKIYIPQSSDQAYIFFLFYQKYSPHQYQKRSLNVSDSKQSSSGMDQVSSLDNIEFVDFNTFEPPQEINSLIIVPVVGNYPVSNYEYKTLYEIKDTLGFPIYRIVSNKQ